ncbi:MAG: hypothetical protein WC663_04465 [Patescibacteria group bacterium]|jgi:hypothetical protein
MKKIISAGVILGVVFLLANYCFVDASTFGQESRFGFLSTGIGITPKAAKKIKTFWLRPHIGQAIWENIEGTKGVFTWTRMDKEVKDAQKYNLQLLVTIWPFATWDQEVCHKNIKNAQGFENELPLKRGAPCDYTAYNNFLTKLIERYDDDGKDDMPGLQYGVKYWEILNEPEMKGDLVFFKGTAKEYFNLLKASYETIKKADSESFVLLGGMAGINPEMKFFWKKVFKLGGKNYFDIGNIHSISSDSEDLNAGAYKSFLKKNKIDKNFWITEVQISSGEIMTPDGPVIRSEEDQANEIVKGYVRAYKAGARKSFYTIYKTDSHASQDLRDSALIFAGIKKPAYYGMKTMVKKLDGFTKAKKISASQYKFKINNKWIYILWSSGVFDTLPSEFMNKNLKVTDMRGSSSVISASGITLSNAPIFVEIL